MIIPEPGPALLLVVWVSNAFLCVSVSLLVRQLGVVVNMTKTVRHLQEVVMAVSWMEPKWPDPASSLMAQGCWCEEEFSFLTWHFLT